MKAELALVQQENCAELVLLIDQIQLVVRIRANSFKSPFATRDFQESLQLSSNGTTVLSLPRLPVPFTSLIRLLEDKVDFCQWGCDFHFWLCNHLHQQVLECLTGVLRIMPLRRIPLGVWSWETTDLLTAGKHYAFLLSHSLKLQKISTRSKIQSHQKELDLHARHSRLVEHLHETLWTLEGATGSRIDWTRSQWTIPLRIIKYRETTTDKEVPALKRDNERDGRILGEFIVLACI